ncbi:hypothetical protein NRIC_17550 [Enterococcus florum]|uniref:Uncharacterized protein n=1 Tax=Enterococcus florum TaxID=2480627 RepID=A0A4P5PBL8_9ENTE|nr:hypothetical protein [Enterococcus florum]GCF93864.1 hypothetical protein NRIC_17550 [Enterococcus florum]
MNQKKWYAQFWYAAAKLIGVLWILLCFDGWYKVLFAAIWVLLAGINVYRGVIYYKQGV